MSWFSSLSNRIFLGSALLAVMTTAAAILVVNLRVSSQAERDIEQGLTEAATRLELYRTVVFEHFTREARMIADLPKLKAAVSTLDPPTVEPLATDYSQRVAADVFVVTDRTGRVLAEIGKSRILSPLPGIQRALQGHDTSGFWRAENGMLQVVTVPILISDPPEILGTLSMGLRLDERLADEFKQITDAEVAFTANGLTLASTLPSEHNAVVARLTGSGNGPTRVNIAGDVYVAATKDLGPTAMVGTSMPTDNTLKPVAVILRSRSDRLKVLNRLHAALAATALLAVTLAVVMSFAVARTVTRPLGIITASMREIAARGDMNRKIDLPEGALGVDADARLLAATFNMMIDSLNRAQREATQRERLSALGRLSTVVAHEVRNPLMIMKTSLRTLRRSLSANVDSPDGLEAIQDIEGELARLNRIVTEVLDFARPIRFERAPTNVNTVCADSVTAVTREVEGTKISLSLDPAVPTISTDAERLRLALVNILVNARHAVEASAESLRDSGKPIALRTAGMDDDVLIDISDAGIGITDDDMPHVFEPYFTTKRTGSGLGLAIAKNIIDGLGGSISVTSQSGLGTTFRIQLPQR